MSADFFSFKAMPENHAKHVQGGKEVLTNHDTTPSGFNDSKFDKPSTGHNFFDDLFGDIGKAGGQGASEWHDEVEHIAKKIHDWFHSDDQGIV